MAATAKPGYYDDGDGTGRKRWWDGSSWTDRYQDATAESGVIWEAVGRPITGLGAGKYRLTAETLYFETGTLSTKAQQIATHEIYDVDAMQTLTQKARGVGDIILMAARGGGARERVALVDIPDFRHGVSVINQTALQARDRLRTKEQTQNINYAGMPVQAAAAAPSAVAPAVDLNTELAKLADLKERGLLDDAEFAAAKKQLLGL